MESALLLIMMRFIICLHIAFCSSFASSKPANIGKVYIDDSKNVHVLIGDRNLQITKHGNAVDASLSADKEYVAWLTLNSWIAPGESERGAGQLSVFHNGRVMSVKCGPFIRDYWFWKGGAYIAIDCGGLHFAGEEILYDTRSLKKIDSFYQLEIPPEQRPAWSSSKSGSAE